MSNTILIKRSSTANAVPAAESLAQGELAINLADGNLFYKNSTNQVTVIASNKFVTVSGQVSAGGNVVGANIVTAGVVSATGNVSGNYFIGNGALLTNVTATGVDAGNLTGSTLSSNVTISSLTTVGTLGSLSVTGTVTGGNIATAGTVSAGGNVTGANIITAGKVSATGNITGSFILGNGALLTGIDAASIQNGSSNVRVVESGGNVAIGIGGISNVAVFDTGGLTVTGNVDSGNVNATLGAFTTVAGTLATAAQPNITSVGTLTSVSVTGTVTGGNLSTAGTVNSTGNITGGNLITAGAVTGNGRALTSLTATNIDTGTLAQARLANSAVTLGSTTLTLGSTVTTVTGLASVTSTTFVGNLTGAATTAGTVTTAAQPNITSVGTLTSVSVTGTVTGGNVTTAGFVSATGTITGGNITTAGSVSASGNITGGNVTTAGLTNTGTLQTSGNAIIGGDLMVNGNTISVNVTNLNVQDPIIGLGRGANNTPLTTNDGKDRGTEMFYFDTAERAAFVGYDNSTGKMIAAANVSITEEIVTVNNFGSLVVGSLESAAVSATGNIVGGNISTTGKGNIATLEVTTLATIKATTAASSTSTGALIVAGGVGVAGNIYAGEVYSDGNLVLTVTSTVDGGTY